MSEAFFELLRAAYAEKHRHYHTAQHVAECLALFEQLRYLAENPDEVEMAIWIHDAIYSTRRGDNEERSAELAERILSSPGVPHDVVERVKELILATRHEAEPRTGDGGLLCDIDLNVLGAPEARFDEYERQVRREYRWVPSILFRRKRAEILDGFLSRSSIYSTEECRARYEDQARRNLQRALSRLR